MRLSHCGPHPRIASCACALYLSHRGLEAGPLSQWMYAGMRVAGLTVESLETRHVRDAFKAMPVKTDRKDAHGIAQLMRLGWFRPVHCKSLPAQEVHRQAPTGSRSSRIAQACWVETINPYLSKSEGVCYLREKASKRHSPEALGIGANAGLPAYLREAPLGLRRDIADVCLNTHGELLRGATSTKRRERVAQQL